MNEDVYYLQFMKLRYYVCLLPYSVFCSLKTSLPRIGSTLCVCGLQLSVGFRGLFSAGDLLADCLTDRLTTTFCTRYIAIVHPSSEKRTIQWTIIINILVWVGSFLMTVPVMIYAMVVRKSDLEICMMFLDGPEDMYWYTLYQSILSFIFPLIIISTFYSLTLYHVFRSIRRVKRKQSVWAKRATKTVVMVIALFLVCWSPYHVIQVINLSNNRPTNTFVYVYNISICLSYSHSCINPLMLLIFAQNYRERLCHRKDLRSSQQNSSKTTVNKADGSSVSTDPNYRCTVIL